MSSDRLAVHSTTAEQIDNFIASPSHAVLIAGPDGIGKTTLAQHIITSLLRIDPSKLAEYPHYTFIAPTGTSISIETIRDLTRSLQLKTIGSQPYRRAILIEHAQGLTTEAQNAYLKLLEEPPADTIMVLTADTPRALLPTIRSRLQTVAVHTPSEQQLQAILASSTKDDLTKRQAYFLSGGLPGLLTALLNGDETHPIVAGVATAKDILQKDTFERLALVDALSKQKETTRAVLEALERMALAGIQGAASKQDQKRIKQWHTIRKTTHVARQAVEQSANIKLVLSNLFLQL